ncbi:MAPEG family protein [Microdochium nivale]|nr:MAPEG family protein [Microdochium nivale]
MSDKKTPKSTDNTTREGIFSGILNPAGAPIAISGLAYVGFIPVTTYLARNESVQNLIKALAGLIPGFSASSATTAGAYSPGIIPALSAIYALWTFGGSGALSATGQAIGRDAQFDNNHPRQHVGELRGFPLRLRSAHYNLLENFTPWALAAALSQVLAPGDPEIVSLLGVHVLLKLGVFYPSYLLNQSLPRSVSHLMANAAFINVLVRLAKK